MPESEVRELSKLPEGIVYTLKLEGTDKIKQDLQEIEESLDRILGKYNQLQAYQNYQRQEDGDIIVLYCGEDEIGRIVNKTISKLDEKARNIAISI